MKLRIKGDSLRLRLSQTELQTFAETGRVADSIRFPGGRSLSYVLTKDAVVGEVTADFAEDAITVRLPAALAQEWAGSDRVGMEQRQVLEGGELRLLIEKDFQCLTERPGEDESDNFPHPLAAQGH